MHIFIRFEKLHVLFCVTLVRRETPQITMCKYGAQFQFPLELLMNATLIV